LKQLYEEADLASAPGSDCPLRLIEVCSEAKRLEALFREIYEED
jgi:hypothetical protein